MKQKLTMFFLMTALAVLLTGCGGSATTGTSRESASDSGSKAENQTVDNGTDTSDPVDTKQDSKKNDDDDSGEGENVLFTKRDLEQSPDLTGAKTLTVKDGETLNINAEGTYIITGTAKNCTIKVDADKKAKVQLVLQDVTVTNTDFPAIYVVSADKCFVTLQGSNSLSVTGSFRSDGETNTDAVIYSREDLTFNGTDTLTLTSSENGISGKDDVKFTGGTYVITSDLDAIEANDSVAVYDGTFTIVTKKDGIHSENSDDNTVGWIVIAGGTMNIQAKSDCLQATT